MDVLFFIKLAMQGGINGLQIRDAMGVPIYGETSLRLDNIGKKCRVPLFMLFSGRPGVEKL